MAVVVVEVVVVEVVVVAAGCSTDDSTEERSTVVVGSFGAVAGDAPPAVHAVTTAASAHAIDAVRRRATAESGRVAADHRPQDQIFSTLVGQA